MVSVDKRTSFCHQGKCNQAVLHCFIPCEEELEHIKNGNLPILYQAVYQMKCAFWKHGRSKYSWGRVYLPRLCGFNAIYMTNEFLNVYLLSAATCNNKDKHII